MYYKYDRIIKISYKNYFYKRYFLAIKYNLDTNDLYDNNDLNILIQFICSTIIVHIYHTLHYISVSKKSIILA